MKPGKPPAIRTVETPAGLIVPADAAEALGKIRTGTNAGAIQCRDADGRRRVVLTRSDQKTINRAVRILESIGLGIVVGCQQTPAHPERCGRPMRNEGRGEPDDGYGCECTRVHFR